MQDRVSTIRSLCIGISAHQKLEHLSSLVTLLGYESLAVFGDCFDEVCVSIVFPLKMSNHTYTLSGACFLPHLRNHCKGREKGDKSVLVIAAHGPIFRAPSIKASLQAVVRMMPFGRVMNRVCVLRKKARD